MPPASEMTLVLAYMSCSCCRAFSRGGLTHITPNLHFLPPPLLSTGGCPPRRGAAGTSSGRMGQEHGCAPKCPPGHLKCNAGDPHATSPAPLARACARLQEPRKGPLAMLGVQDQGSEAGSWQGLGSALFSHQGGLRHSRGHCVCPGTCQELIHADVA